MKWNDIREKVKNQSGSMNMPTEKSAAVTTSSSVAHEARIKSKRTVSIIVAAVVILIAIIVIWCIPSKKVTNYGPATDIGVTRQEAQDTQMFLQQIPLKPLTPEQREMIKASSAGLESSGTNDGSTTSKTGN